MPMSTVSETRSDLRLRLTVLDVLAVLSLCAIGGVVYGSFAHMLGYYWDDWPVVWVYHALGRDGVTKYFSGLRPVYGWLYAVAAPILGESPMGWQILALVIRCAACITWYFAFCTLWPRRRDVAWLVGISVLLFPGFTLQPVALSLFQYHMSFMLFAVSFAATILALTRPAYRWIFLGVSLITGALSYLIIEYFLGLELFRLSVIMVLTRREYGSWNVDRLRTSLLRWSPYAAVWTGYFVWRAFFFRVAANYSKDGYMDVSSDLAPILKHPILETLSRISVGVHNILMSTVFALIRPLSPDLLSFNAHAAVLSMLIIAVVVAIGFYTFRRLHVDSVGASAVQGTADDQRRFLKEALFLGLAGLVVAELPLLASNLEVTFNGHPAFPDRWTLPFMVPASLTLATLLTLLDKRRVSKVLVVSSLLLLFSAFQIQNQRAYHQDWLAQKSLFWQFAWRAPVLKEGTGVLVEGLPLSLYGNHSSGVLDLLYKRNDRSGNLDYFIFDLTGVPWARPTVTYRPGDVVVGRVRWFSFRGTTNQAVVSWMSPAGVLRIVSPSDANEVLHCSALCDNISYLSRPDEVISDAPQRPAGPLLDIFGPEPRHDWPYFYQRAELQRQLKHWAAIAALGDEVMREGYRPADPSEWFPFIDGYARAGRYRVAAGLSKKMLDEDPDAITPLSSLWKSVQHEDGSRSPELEAVLRDLNNRLMLGDLP